MEIDVISVIGQVGFPIAICLGAMFFIYKIYWANREDSIKREEKHYDMMYSFQSTLDKVTDVLRQYGDKLQDIENDVRDIKQTINKN